MIGERKIEVICGVFTELRLLNNDFHKKKYANQADQENYKLNSIDLAYQIPIDRTPPSQPCVRQVTAVSTMWR